MLELRGLSKSFVQSGAYSGSQGDAATSENASNPLKTIVQPLDLQIRDGEFFSLLGPSGCGKTTLLRMISGFETPSGGEIHYDGKRVDQLPPHHRPFNLVFQRYALFPHLNVFDNVAFGPRVRLNKKETSEAEIKKRVEEALALVQMESMGGRAISTLSGGQQQRIALARALINRPKILLLDEPLSALDLKLRQQMQVELLALQRRLKLTFIFVTHDQEEALTLSDRIAVMNQGQIEQMGTPQEIYEYPKTAFVAQFIGSINNMEALVQEVKPESVALSLGVSRRPVLVKPSRDGARPLPLVNQGSQVRVMVRPEKLKVLKSNPTPDQNYVEGILKEVLYLGATTQYQVQIKEGSAPQFSMIASLSNSAVTSRKNFASGEKVYLAWHPEDCLLVGGQNGSPVALTSAQPTAVVSSGAAPQ